METAGEGKEALALAIAGTKLQHPALSERFAKYSDISAWKAVEEDQVVSSGWVVDTLETALWAFFKFDAWREGALAVVNLGGDADTVGAVYGGLAGTFYGMEAIPAEWTDGMQKKKLISQVADEIAKLV